MPQAKSKESGLTHAAAHALSFDFAQDELFKIRKNPPAGNPRVRVIVLRSALHPDLDHAPAGIFAPEQAAEGLRHRGDAVEALFLGFQGSICDHARHR